MSLPQFSRLYALDHGTIDAEVKQIGPGVFVLDKSSNGGFTVAFVGRSDTDLNASLHSHVGTYRFFKYAYSSSPHDAFEDECNLYHYHRPSGIADHPVRPVGSQWKCAHCRVFD